MQLYFAVLQLISLLSYDGAYALPTPFDVLVKAHPIQAEKRLLTGLL